MGYESNFSQGPQGQSVQRELDLFDLVAFVWTQKFFAFFIAVIVFVPLFFLASVSIKPTYEATSRLLVIQDENDLTPGAAGSGGAFTLDQVMESEAEILNTDEVRRLALSAHEGSGASLPLGAMRDGFSVSRAPNSSILVAGFEHSDPNVAANTLNAIVDAYLAYRVELLIGGANGAIDERLGAAEAEAASAEAALREFLVQNTLVDFDSERSAVLNRITDLQARALSARADAASASAFARSLTTRLATIPETIELYVENSVTGQLLDLQVRRRELLARYQPDAPPVLTVEREIEALETFIGEGGAEGQGQRRTGTNPIWQTLEGERLQQEAYASSQSQLASALERQLAEARAEADRLRALGPEHDRLQRAVNARSEAASRLSVQAADASARRNAPAGAADAVRVVERAAVPTEASSLKVPAILAAFVFACGVGVMAALFRGYLAMRAYTQRQSHGPSSGFGERAREQSPSPSAAMAGTYPSPEPPPRPRNLPVLARIRY